MPERLRDRVQKKFHTSGRTKQSFKDEADVNHIMSRYRETGVLPSQMSRPPTYGDFDQVIDYHSAMNEVKQAQRSFDALPSSVRSRFHNNPGELIQFMEDPETLEEQIELGLTRAPNLPPIPPATIVPTNTPTSEIPEAETPD